MKDSQGKLLRVGSKMSYHSAGTWMQTSSLAGWSCVGPQGLKFSKRSTESALTTLSLPTWQIVLHCERSHAWLPQIQEFNIRCSESPTFVHNAIKASKKEILWEKTPYKKQDHSAQIFTRWKWWSSNCLVDYRYSFQGSSNRFHYS